MSVIANKVGHQCILVILTHTPYERFYIYASEHLYLSKTPHASLQFLEERI
jgi:hypothetical protein